MLLNRFQTPICVVTLKYDVRLEEVTKGARSAALSLRHRQHIACTDRLAWEESQYVSVFLYQAADLNDLLGGVISLHR
jgi:hypothetical protein